MVSAERLVRFWPNLDSKPKARAEEMAGTDKIRGKSDTGSKPAEIGVLVYPGAQTSALGGLTDLFVTANRMSTERNGAGSRILRITHWALQRDCAQFECVYDTESGDHEPRVALILPPSLELDGYRVSDQLHERWICEQHARGAVVCSICAGAFLLGGTGLLSGRPATNALDSCGWSGRAVS
jgi:transcriptional regulator GlxA family with amidase domain